MISEQGSYGCEFHDTGTLILCNPKQKECKGYTAPRTKIDRKYVLDSLDLAGLELAPDAEPEPEPEPELDLDLQAR